MNGNILNFLFTGLFLGILISIILLKGSELTLIIRLKLSKRKEIKKAIEEMELVVDINNFFCDYDTYNYKDNFDSEYDGYVFFKGFLSEEDAFEYLLISIREIIKETEGDEEQKSVFYEAKDLERRLLKRRGIK